jgi:molecular chaperone DnaK (HSP70)
VPGTPSTRTAQTSAIGADLEAEARSALKQWGDVIVRSADDIEKVATATQDAIKNRELKELAAQSAEVRAQIDKTTEAVKNQLKDAKATASAEKEALAELQAALQKFSF